MRRQVRRGGARSASGGHVLDHTRVIPSTTLTRIGIKHVDKLRPHTRQPLLEVIDDNPRRSNPRETGTIKYGKPVDTTCSGKE